MTKSILTTLAVGAFCSTAFAGTASIASSGKGKAVAPAPAPAAPAAALGLTLTGGYDTTYFWHGTRVGDQLWTQKLEYSTALSDKVSLTVGEWYGHLNEYKYNELDLYAALGYNAGPVTVSLGFTYYKYIDGASLDAQYEPSLRISSNSLPVDLYAAYYYETEVAGSYIEVGASKAFKISECLSLVAGANVGYNDGLTTPESGWNHVNVSLALPISLSSSVTFTPYIAGNFAQDATKGLYQDDNILVGGAALAIKF
jgi:hypothetical protein